HSIACPLFAAQTRATRPACTCRRLRHACGAVWPARAGRSPGVDGFMRDDQEELDAGGRPREPEVEEAFDRLVSEGRDRLARPLLPLAATGFVGGLHVGVGVLAFLVVDHQTGQPLLAAAGFPVGFLALLLARSELFTENFLVPVTAPVAGHGSWWQLLRLWLGGLGAEPARGPGVG